MIPYYLKDHLSKTKEKKDKTTAILSSSTGNTNLEIYYYGELIEIKRTPFIIDSNLPCLVVAKDPISNEEFVVFDGMIHGYDAMFSRKIKTYEERELEKYNKFSGEVEIILGYSIDYDDEIEEFNFTIDGKVKLMYGEMDWNEAKSIGYDWISLRFKKGKKGFLDLELA